MLTKTQRKEIIEMSQQKRTIPEISKTLNVPKSTISSILAVASGKYACPHCSYIAPFPSHLNTHILRHEKNGIMPTMRIDNKKIKVSIVSVSTSSLVPMGEALMRDALDLASKIELILPALKALEELDRTIDAFKRLHQRFELFRDEKEKVEKRLLCEAAVIHSEDSLVTISSKI